MPKPKEQEWRKRQIENEWEKTKIHFLFVFIVERFYKLNLSTAVCLRLSVYLCYVAAWKNISRSHSPLFSSFWLNFYDIYCEHWGICQRMFFVSDRTTHIHKRLLSLPLCHTRSHSLAQARTYTNVFSGLFVHYFSGSHTSHQLTRTHIFTIPNMLSTSVV